jgi:hypothetical protein
VIVADQIPVKLAPDVIKNTNLKIAHRVVAADDRMALAGAMAMNERQAHALATLRVGEAAVFAEGDDAPLLVRVPLSNAKLIERAAGNMEVQQSWARLQQDGLPSSLYQSYATCATLCSDPFSGCINLRRAAEQPEARAGAAMLLLSLALTSDEQEIAGHLEADLPDLLSALRAHLSPGDDRRAMHCALTHVMRAVLEQRGGQYGWRFELVGALAERVLPAILAAAAGQPISAQAMDALAEYRRLYQQACAHPGPYQGCEQVCGAACFHRHAVQSFALQDDLQAAFRSAVSDDEAFSQVASLADYVVDQILLSGAPPEYRRQAAGCFVVHQIHAWREFGWEDRSALLDSLLSELAAAGEEADA